MLKKRVNKLKTQGKYLILVYHLQVGMDNFVEVVNFSIYYEKLDIYCLRFEYVSYILIEYYIGEYM